MRPIRDVHSYANPGEVRVSHAALDLDVLFDRRILRGTAELALARVDPSPNARSLRLDTRGLDVTRAESSSGGGGWSDAAFELGDADAILGAPLTVALRPGDDRVRITYATRPTASGLQWLEPAQTAGRRHPFLFSQSQAIHARSWIPIQDTPQVRLTYEARVRTPPELAAVMSAGGNPEGRRGGEYRFTMPQPIPAYLLAIAAGDIGFAPMSRRTGVYAEPSVVGAAAREFEDTEKMMEAAERLYGPYRWERYDILVLPPSFPFGGMENPRLTFATPTVLAGDKSLVSLIAHELAHSWSGNLVTNATWRDFWLNEGFTTYLERRLVEEVYGRDAATMEAVLGRQDLEDELERLEDRDEILHIDLTGRDPDDGATRLPYEKGSLFLRSLEELFGRERFDAYLRGYFDRFAFRSILTEDFLDDLRANLFATDAGRAKAVPLEAWIEAPALPAEAPQPVSAALDAVARVAEEWTGGRVASDALPFAGWSTQQRIQFLRRLPSPLPAARMAELDRALGLTESRNNEVAFQWLLMSLRSGYAPANGRLEEFLVSIGRRKYIKPLYEELVKTPEGHARARAIYARARPGYHPIAVDTMDRIVGRPG
ncbi:MAG TPA: M1 family metallopeptidase [Thermoanaerobaculia bacterium]|jgi:aminopeptidase N|nr:M1 family metallopeptidase [Thermoanaerobaculia bacterium]